MTQQSDHSASQSGPTIVYYRDHNTLVTDRLIHTDHGRFLVSDLESIYREYEETHLALKIALYSAGFELVLAVPVAIAYGAITLLCAGFVAAAGVGTAAAVESRRNPTWMVLTAEHNGRVVTLYSTADHEQFGKVHRAVLRAVEANEKPELRPGTDLMVREAPHTRSGASRARPRPYDHR
jgi:hypothetical protein